METIFKLKLSGDGIDLDREVDQETARQVVNIVLGGGTIAGLGSCNPSPAKSVQQREAPLSLREYLDDVQAIRKPDQILAIANFICEHEEAEDFSRDDVKSRFSLAREPLPANFGRDFSWTEKNGWVATVHGKSGSYYVTAKGIEAIENRFSTEIKKATSQNKGAARRRRRDRDNET